MSTSFRLEINSTISDIRTIIFPPIHLNPTREYEIACMKFSTYNTIPNITEENNRLQYSNRDGSVNHIFPVPEGCYTFESLTKHINEHISSDQLTFNYHPGTGRCTILCNDLKLRFDTSNNLLNAFGFFESGEVRGDFYHSDEADSRCVKLVNNIYSELDNIDTIDTTNILECAWKLPPSAMLLGKAVKLSGVRNTTQSIHSSPYPMTLHNPIFASIKCNLIRDSYKNNSHIKLLHSFLIPRDSYTVFTDEPTTPIYLPLNCASNIINEIDLRVEDIEGNLINFGGSEFSIVLHIRQR